MPLGCVRERSEYFSALLKSEKNIYIPSLQMLLSSRKEVLQL